MCTTGKKKCELNPVEDFDPRPVELRGKLMERLKTFQGSRPRPRGVPPF